MVDTAAERDRLQRRSIFRSITLYANVTLAKRKIVCWTWTFRMGTVWWVSTFQSTMVVARRGGLDSDADERLDMEQGSRKNSLDECRWRNIVS